MKLASGCAIGAFVNGLENLTEFQTLIDRKLAVILSYIHWPETFPRLECEQVSQNGSLPLLTWEPWVSDPAGNLEAILRGQYQDYIETFLRAAKEWGKPVLLRWAHEMNGNWYPWSGFQNGQAAGPEKFKKVWLYIYNVKRALKADNVSLVWCPNNASLPNDQWNQLAAYYPGDQYVDWVGIDGYNWGFSQWQSFEAIFAEPFRQISALTQKPLMIGEFAAAEAVQPDAVGTIINNKADWIREALQLIKEKHPQLKLFCWFSLYLWIKLITRPIPY